MSAFNPLFCTSQTDWSKCCLCQSDKKEDLHQRIIHANMRMMLLYVVSLVPEDEVWKMRGDDCALMSDYICRWVCLRVEGTVERKEQEECV